MQIAEELREGFIGPVHPAWSIVSPEHRGCPVAFTVALELQEDINDGTRNYADAEREFDLRVSGRCMTGAIVVGNEVACLLEPAVVR